MSRLKFVNKYWKDANRIKEIQWKDSGIPGVDAFPTEKAYAFEEDKIDPMVKKAAKTQWKRVLDRRKFLKK